MKIEKNLKKLIDVRHENQQGQQTDPSENKQKTRETIGTSCCHLQNIFKPTFKHQ